MAPAMDPLSFFSCTVGKRSKQFVGGEKIAFKPQLIQRFIYNNFFSPLNAVTQI